MSYLHERTIQDYIEQGLLILGIARAKNKNII